MEIAAEENLVMPSVYQGQYNVFCRGYEDELFPVLREFGIDFEATSPLAGGFLTGKLSYSPSPEQLEGTRFEVGELGRPDHFQPVQQQRLVHVGQL